MNINENITITFEVINGYFFKSRVLYFLNEFKKVDSLKKKCIF